MPETGEDSLESLVAELRLENEQLRSGYVSLSQRLIGLRMVQHIAEDLVSERDVDRLLRRILHAAISAVEARAGALLLLDAGRRELVFSVVEGGGGAALIGRRMPFDQGVAGWAVAHNEPLIVADARTDERFFAEISQGVNFQVDSLMCVPLATRGEVLGAIQMLNKTHHDHFDDDDLDILGSFAAQSAAALENARLYEELRRERDRILAVEEEVRRRLSRDLHDGPAQLLANIILGAEIVKKVAVLQPEKVPDEVDCLLPLCHKALRQVRTLLFDLRPVVLETQGLVPALELYVQKQQELDTLACHLQVHGFARRLPPATEQAIFGIVQEAVGNVKKHARAQNLWIVVGEQGGRLLVGVRDDGRGFDQQKLEAEYDQRGSLGMLNMRERAAAIGGKLAVRSRPGAGTTVALSVDLPPP